MFFLKYFVEFVINMKWILSQRTCLPPEVYGLHPSIEPPKQEANKQPVRRREFIKQRVESPRDSGLLLTTPEVSSARRFSQIYTRSCANSLSKDIQVSSTGNCKLPVGVNISVNLFVRLCEPCGRLVTSTLSSSACWDGLSEVALTLNGRDVVIEGWTTHCWCTLFVQQSCTGLRYKSMDLLYVLLWNNIVWSLPWTQT